MDSYAKPVRQRGSPVGRLILSLLIVACWTSMVSAAKTDVAAGNNAISTALAAASAGDTLVLVTDGGVYNEDLTLVVDKAITIQAAAGLTDPPVWTCDHPSRQITLDADLTLDGIIFDGSANDSLTTDCIRSTTTAGIDLRVYNCVFRNFSNGAAEPDGHAIKGGTGTRMDSVVVTNTLFEHMPGEHISFKDEDVSIAPGSAKYLRIENCTFWDGGNEAFYIQAHDAISAGTPDPEVFVNHVTVVDMGSKALYPNTCDNAVIKNSIVAYSSSGEYACRIYGTGSVVENFLYYACPDSIGLEDGATADQLINVLREKNPLFVDPENGNFDLYANSPAVGAATGGADLGDPRWDVLTAAGYTLTVATVGSGSVTLDPAGTVFASGTQVSLTAVPETGWEFAGWSGDVTSTENPVTVTV
ncbi:MAG: hypothetical protein ACETWG_13435, partial [Candidatus Neomarinimicrobiota bacterium]